MNSLFTNRILMNEGLAPMCAFNSLRGPKVIVVDIVGPKK